jgi:macrolide-specific efflux system membrane fusion protein
VLVNITYAQKQNVVEVPTFAVNTTDGTSTVTVVDNGVKQTRDVTTGLTSGGMVEITSGLQPGEQVMVSLPNFGGLGTARRTAGTVGT